MKYVFWTKKNRPGSVAGEGMLFLRLTGDVGNIIKSMAALLLSFYISDVISCLCWRTWKIKKTFSLRFDIVHPKKENGMLLADSDEAEWEGKRVIVRLPERK